MYLDRQDKKRFRLSKKMKKALPYFVLAFIGVLFLALLFDDLNAMMNPKKNPLQSYYEGSVIVAGHGWSPIMQYLVLLFAPFVIVTVLVSWLIHGVGFYFVR
jgi:hypothetical protein